MTQRLLADFSMEIDLEPGLPMPSGGLGVLAGDTPAPSCATFIKIFSRRSSIML